MLPTEGNPRMFIKLNNLITSFPQKQKKSPMTRSIGWLVHHTDKLIIKASGGAPTIRLKFYTYPPYRQTITTPQPPHGCSLRTKGLNTYYLYQGHVPTRGTLSLERTIAVTPQPQQPPHDYGTIHDIPTDFSKKYKQSHPYWPTNSKAIQDLAAQHWFSTDDLRHWLLDVSQIIPNIIHQPSPQEKRWGAEAVIQTGIGDCDEFTDLFITLARLRGIPSRRLTGYFIHTNTTTPEPHAWAECYTPTVGWIPVDLAQHNIGHHTHNYLVQKIEEFNPDLRDF